MTMKPKPKKQFKIVCPWCKKSVIVREFEEVLKPSVKATKKEWITAKMDPQTKLPKGDKKA